MILDDVNMKSSLSPLNIFALLAPLSLKSPLPSDIFCSISGAWEKLDETIILLLFSFSTHLYAIMSLLFPVKFLPGLLRLT